MVGGKRWRLYVAVDVKPYCYRYLVNNFQIEGKSEGIISLRRHRLLKLVLRNMLQHKTRLPYVPANIPEKWRTRTVYIDIGPHDVEHYGLDLTPECKAEFARLVEQFCHEDFRQFLIHTYMVEPRVQVILEQYQHLRGYSEEDWPLESLQKIVTRMGVTSQMKRTREEFLQKFNNIFTAKVSKKMDCKTRIKQLSQHAT